MVHCKHGKLKSPVRDPSTGIIRRCKLKKKTHLGRQRDYRGKSHEYHEVRYRRG